MSLDKKLIKTAEAFGFTFDETIERFTCSIENMYDHFQHIKRLHTEIELLTNGECHGCGQDSKNCC